MSARYIKRLQFQSTPSSRRETAPRRRLILATRHISIHSLLAEGDGRGPARRRGRRISIHSLLAEGDAIELTKKQLEEISIHSLLAEGDL